MWQKLTQLNIAASLVAQCWHYSMRGNYQLHTNLIGTKNKYVPTSYLLKNVLQTCYLVLVASIIMCIADYVLSANKCNIGINVNCKGS